MKAKLKLIQRQTVLGELTLAQMLAVELEELVRPEALNHWDEKIKNRIVPTKVKAFVKTSEEKEDHERKLQKLGLDQALFAKSLLLTDWKSKNDGNPIELHYFGVGTGEALEHIVPMANDEGYKVVAYDTSDVGRRIGLNIFERSKREFANQMLLADIEDVFDPRYLNPERASKFFVARVLDVLDKQEKGWEKIPAHERKMPRTARKIGSCLRYMEGFLLHPCPEDNPDAVWGDTTPHPLEDVIGYMQEGVGYAGTVKADLLGKLDFYGNIYRGVRVRLEKS